MALPLLIICFIISYGVFGILLLKGWRKVQSNEVPIMFHPSTSVNVIVPVRNEKEHISLLLKHLSEQHYPGELLRIYLVDDQSTDGSTEIIRQWCTLYPQQYVCLTVSDEYISMKGKKKAIATAIAQSAGELIITTDADCRLQPQWIRNTVYLYEQSKPMFISGPVKMKGHDTFWGRFQEIEFASLIGTGASAIGLNMPMMCNGANLAYSRKAYESVKGFEGNEQIASGDDEFLMHKIATSFPGKVAFIKHRQSVVETDAPGTWNEFLQQRKRWAGKWEHYTMRYIQVVALWVFLVHFILLLSIGLVLTGVLGWYWMLALWATKAVFDYFYLKSVTHFLSVRFKIDIFINSVLIYPLYVVTFGLLSRFGKYDWKERTESIS